MEGWASKGMAPGGWASKGWAWGGVGQQPPPWPVAGDGAPRYEVCEEAVAFQLFLERAAEIDVLEPNLRAQRLWKL